MGEHGLVQRLFGYGDIGLLVRNCELFCVVCAVASLARAKGWVCALGGAVHGLATEATGAGLGGGWLSKFIWGMILVVMAAFGWQIVAHETFDCHTCA